MDELSRYPIHAMPGQLNPNTEFGNFLRQIVKHPRLKTFVEFGTWNGMGSTKSIMDGLIERTDDTIFTSFEANEERHLVAKKLWESREKGRVDLRLCYGKVSEEIYEFGYVKVHKRYLKEMELWYDLEVNQTVSAPLVHDVIPERVDFILFDGGEFSTIGDWEYMKKYKPLVIALDDINSFKTCDIFEELKQDDGWDLIATGGHHDKVDKFTWACFMKI